MGQAFITDNIFWQAKPHEVAAVERKFYKRPKNAGGDRAIFTLRHVAAQFSLLALGFFFSGIAFALEFQRFI